MDEGRIVRWDGQVRWPLVVNGIKVCLMVPDFRVWLSNSKYELHETKGFQQPLWKLKRKLFEALHPDIPYVVITAKDMASL
jgi:hypothetical protein